MNDDVRFERLLDDTLVGAAPSRAPERLRHDISSTTSRIRQRGRWLALLKEPPMRLSSGVAVGSPTLRLAAVMAITLALVLAGVAAVAVGASIAPRPARVLPYTHNGVIAYASSSDIWVTDADLSDRHQITHLDGVTQDPQWSPDGSRLSAWHSQDGVASVLILDQTGTVVRTLSAPDGYSFPSSYDPLVNLYAAWSPDGSSLAALVQADGAGRIDVNGHRLAVTDLAVFDLESGAGTPLHIERPVLTGFQWSPDGRHIAYVAVGDDTDTGWLEAVRPDGSDMHQISRPSSGVGGDTGQRMLPDGSGMIVDDYDTSSLVRVPVAEQGDPVTVLRSPSGQWSVWASVSPTGTEVAYIRGDPMQLRVMGTDGSGDHPVLEDVSNPSPVWAPDGSALLIKHNGTFNIVPIGDPSTGLSQPISIPASSDLGVVSWQGVP